MIGAKVPWSLLLVLPLDGGKRGRVEAEFLCACVFQGATIGSLGFCTARNKEKPIFQTLVQSLAVFRSVLSCWGKDP